MPIPDLSPIRAVLFDMDGLLLDSERVAYAIGRETSEHLGLPWRHEAAIDAGRFDLKPGVHELFDLLDERGLKRAVATSTRRARAIAKLDGVGVWPRLQGLVGGDEVARGKPAPDIYLAAARLLEVPIADCLVLEDSNTGVRGGLAT